MKITKTNVKDLFFRQRGKTTIAAELKFGVFNTNTHCVFIVCMRFDTTETYVQYLSF